MYELTNGNGKVKEYNDSNELIFEGEHLDWKRNGKGKEYYKGQIEYEGEYLNDEKNGKGKEYDNGKILFEGVYREGKKWNGNAKNYNIKGLLSFEGQYINGEITGKGREYDFQIELYKNKTNSGNAQLVIKNISKGNIMKEKNGTE